VNVDDNATQMRIEARFDEREQLLLTSFTRPPTRSGWIDRYSVGLHREDIENTIDSTASVAFERRGIDERNTPVFGGGFYYDRQEPEGADDITSHATYVEAGYIWRRVDDIVSPTRGYMIDVRAGGGIPGISTRGFGRVYSQAAAWYPVNRNTELYLRGEAGAVLASERDGIPSVFLFRTGGDTSVRGYAFRSLGVPLGDAIVGGRYLAVGSVEVIRWIDATWGIAAFLDAGDAVDDLGDFDPAIGVGLGARVRTPIGPFRLDVAWGERTESVRIHFSVGVSF
jgi:translocation and assembly module TamA